MFVTFTVDLHLPCREGILYDILIISSLGGALTAMLNFLTEIVNAGVSHVGFKDLFDVSINNYKLL